ncbi:hypothetical protein SAMN05192559_10710 [Halobacillus karajensis]|uniref:hypothetical protein n=1 Tax=Halobacillus karajensis TaxID=195088 RepID=UPI0008A76BA3|nr:hypothetical protein [Halobacillus karajensis]SEI00065.1 hypothetical protein SAMN05192559_10710 [Halobacillus karajensis]
MDYALLFGVLLTLFPLVTIKKVKEETTFQRVVHIGCLLIGIILLAGFAIQFDTFIGKY